MEFLGPYGYFALLENMKTEFYAFPLWFALRDELTPSYYVILHLVRLCYFLRHFGALKSMPLISLFLKTWKLLCMHFLDVLVCGMSCLPIRMVFCIFWEYVVFLSKLWFCHLINHAMPNWSNWCYGCLGRGLGVGKEWLPSCAITQRGFWNISNGSFNQE